MEVPSRRNEVLPECSPTTKRFKPEQSNELNDSTPLYLLECCPVKNLGDLYTVINNPPMWSNDIPTRADRSGNILKNSLRDCHYKVTEYSYQQRLDERFTPKTLVCHDYKGGYLDDRHLTEVKKGNLYSFYNWCHIDIFVYFSHHFITIPPLCWLDAAHKNGVKILGTLITESENGKQMCDEIFKDMSTMQQFAQNLAKVVDIFKLDGWLLNIENPIEQPLVLKKFVEYLTECVHEVNQNAVIIWYDSVTEDGHLKWQNELNDKNMCFFEKCDGIFLNYVWNEQNLINSLNNAKWRSLDVFVGIDVFGRNTYGGGQFNSYKAAEIIRRFGLSMAIFAPGWTHESIVESKNDSIPLIEHFLNKDTAFWNSLWPSLYTHPIKKFFETSFFIGSDKNRFNLFDQQIQLSKILHPKYSFLIPNYSEIPTLERKCHCIRLEYDNDRTCCLINKQALGNDTFVHRIFVCDIPVEGELLISLIKKKEPIGTMNLRIMTCLKNGALHVISLNGREQESLRSDQSLTEVNPAPQDSEIMYSLKERYGCFLKSSDILAYTFSVQMCYILEIGAILEDGDAVCLESFVLSKFHT